MIKGGKIEAKILPPREDAVPCIKSQEEANRFRQPLEKFPHYCFECGRECNNRRELGNHVAKKHPYLNCETYCAKWIHGEFIPECSCGCHKRCSWHKLEYRYSENVSGHNLNRNIYSRYNQPYISPDSREKNKNSVRNSYNDPIRGKEIREKISQKLKTAYETTDLKERLSQSQKES